MAYQIATAASELESKEFSGVPYVLLLVLSRIGNFPALSYAKRRYLIAEESLPLRVLAESDARKEANSIQLGDTAIALTDFQHHLWTELNTGEAIGISAPTSAGKSFILQAYARKLLAEGSADNIAFLVPTRALINQVSGEASEWLRNTRLDVELVTTPIAKDTPIPVRSVYVVTQERMQLLQTAHPDLSFEVMLVDEAQSIADGSRGVLLSSVIEEALNRNEKMQLLFAGPNIDDPGEIAALFGRKPRSIRTDEATVVQNIVFVDCDKEKPNSAKLGFLSEEKKVALGTIECDQPLTDHRSKLVNLALRLGGGGQNLIYALGPAECESIAFGLADGEQTIELPELKDLSDFVKEAVHPKYQLAVNVLQGVGFHYGRLPSLVRKAIEDSFAEGRLQFLVTTSTLLYGVNLPAQNLFLHNPQKGQNQPISAIDFWNLAGRAGRLGKEFTGNIFLID
jgi:replicative superfamily II helicase